MLWILMQLNEAKLPLTTWRCLSVDNSLFSVENLSCSIGSQASNTVILSWFSVWKKLLQYFLTPTQGGVPLECSEESDCKNSEIKLKLAYTTDLQGYHVTLTRLLRVTQLLSDSNCIKIVCIEKWIPCEVHRIYTYA